MPDSAGLSQRRLTLIKRLSSLSAAQFDQVIFVLQPQPGLIPPSSATGGDRAAALLQWAESEIGCGWEPVEQALAAVLDGKAAVPASPTVPMDNQRSIQLGDGADHSTVISGDRNCVEFNYNPALPTIPYTSSNSPERWAVPTLQGFGVADGCFAIADPT